MAGIEDVLVCGDELCVGGGGEGAFEAVFGGALNCEGGEAEERALEAAFFGYGHVFLGVVGGGGGGGDCDMGGGQSGEEGIAFPN